MYVPSIKATSLLQRKSDHKWPLPHPDNYATTTILTDYNTIVSLSPHPKRKTI